MDPLPDLALRARYANSRASRLAEGDIGGTGAHLCTPNDEGAEVRLRWSFPVFQSNKKVEKQA